MPGLLRLYKKLRRVPNDLQFYDLVQQGRVSPTLAITCRGKRDGGGAQANACISAMAFARASGIAYLHTPFQFVEHAEGDQAAWTTKWEEFFGLAAGERVITPMQGAVGVKEFLDRAALWKRDGIVVEAQHYQGICNAHPEMYAAILPSLREKYRSHDKSGIALHRGDEDMTVAVHIRRGDVSLRDAATADRFTSDERILKILHRVLAVLAAKGRTVRVNIYSEGRAEDFKLFADLGCHLHVGLDVFETVHNLAMSDVLVTAKSAFSFVAGLISTGVKLYEPYQSIAPDDWLKLDADGNFNHEALSARLSEKLRA
ncbi:MAG: hypothetical protein V4441_04130 [Pseudomonadota bacterium]